MELLEDPKKSRKSLIITGEEAKKKLYSKANH